MWVYQWNILKFQNFGAARRSLEVLFISGLSVDEIPTATHIIGPSETATWQDLKFRRGTSIAIFTVYKHPFCYSNVPTMKTKELFVSVANRPLVGTLISINDVTRNIAIPPPPPLTGPHHCIRFLSSEFLKQGLRSSCVAGANSKKGGREREGAGRDLNTIVGTSPKSCARPTVIFPRFSSPHPSPWHESMKRANRCSL